jgi:hypothetical protein
MPLLNNHQHFHQNKYKKIVGMEFYIDYLILPDRPFAHKNLMKE